MARLGRGQPNRPVIRRTPTPAGGTGTLPVAFTLSGAGAKHTAGTGTLHIDFSGSGAGTKATAGSGSLATSITLSGTGTKRTGIGPPPRPRNRWQLVAGPASGGHELGLTAAKNRKFTAKLREPSELRFDIDGRHPQAIALQADELATDVHLLWTSADNTTRILDRHRAGSTVGDDITESAHAMTIGCLDYRAVLSRRELYSDDALTYAGIDQGEIAWGLISSTQGNTAGHLGISKGWTGTSPTGIVRDVTYVPGDKVGERITELSETPDGFDWDIEPVSASGMQLKVWHPERGVNRGVVLILGGLVARARREFTAADYANAIRYSGADGLTARELEAPDLATRPEGRWDAVYGDTGLTTQSMLDQRSAWQLDWSQVVRPVWTVTLKRGAWAGPDHIWLGDPVRLIVRSGSRNTDDILRVYEVQIDLDGRGGEQVTLVLGGPRPDYRRRPRQTERRLTNLERR